MTRSHPLGEDEPEAVAEQTRSATFFSKAGYCCDASVLVATLFAKTELGAAAFTSGEPCGFQRHSTT